MISKELKAKAATFLQNITQHNELAEIVDVLKVNLRFSVTFCMAPHFHPYFSCFSGMYGQ